MAAVTPLIVIAGPTASGKSALALALAKKWGGEILCADSRTVYKGMDIGTAKPSKTEQKSVHHWLLDIVEPGERFTVHDFQQRAYAAIEDIRSRGKIPFLVGGTGLYIDAVVLHFVFGPDSDIVRRHELNELSVEELISLHEKQHIPLPENKNNRRYLIRSVEKNNSFTSRNKQPDTDTFVFGIRVERDRLREQIRERIEHMFANNIVLETQHLLQKYGTNNEAMTGNIYRVAQKLVRGEIGTEEAMQLCLTRDYQLAKRQVTWLKRHDYVRWGTVDEVREEIEVILQNSVTPEQFSGTMEKKVRRVDDT